MSRIRTSVSATPHSIGADRIDPLQVHIRTARHDAGNVLGKAPDLQASYVLGMPHLSMGGLSENWLLKECGHMHWLRLALRLGLDAPDFKDMSGRPVNAAFTALRLSDARLDQVSVNARLDVRTSLRMLSKTEAVSTHVLMSENMFIGHLALISVFVARARKSDNRSLARALAMLHHPLPDGRDALNGSEIGNVLNGASHDFRKGHWDVHWGFRRAEAREIHSFSVCPCPLSDFNGADLLYFANFQTFVDRAQWHWTAKKDTIRRTVLREIFYGGNVNVGESLRIVVCGIEPETPLKTDTFENTWCRIIRDADGQVIADVFTRKRLEDLPRTQ
jgi:probable biosynthetic protein (TIGR04099 family)